jgi:hypothetical protein
MSAAQAVRLRARRDNESDPSRKGLVNIAEDKIYVTGLKGPLEDG